MHMRLMNINSNVTIDMPADTKSHTLSFRPVTPMGQGIGIGGSGSYLVLALTQQEASTYQLGKMYDVVPVLSEDQQLTHDEIMLETGGGEVPA